RARKVAPGAGPRDPRVHPFSARAHGAHGACFRRDEITARHALGAGCRRRRRGAAERDAQGFGACRIVGEFASDQGGHMSTSGTWEPSLRYPDPSVKILNPSFAKYRLPVAGVERLATRLRWGEGPAYFRDGRHALWGHIPNNPTLRWGEETGSGRGFRK